MRIDFYLLLGLFAVVGLLLPMFILGFMKNGKAKTIILSVLLVLYSAVLLVGVWAQVTVAEGNVAISFDFTGEVLGKPIDLTFANLTNMDIISNLLMLIPTGLVLSYFFRNKKFLTAILICWYFGFAIGFLIELSQFVLPIDRFVQLSDVIFNMISLFVGGLIGGALVRFSKRIYRKVE